MKKKKVTSQDRIRKIISLILLIAWCLVIFSFSNQVGNVSTDSSSRLINFINNLFKINLYEFKYSVFIVRKLAHMFLYFILFILCYNCFKKYELKKYNLYSLGFSLIYSISDEIHQLFIVGRTFKIMDIGIDFLGALIGFIFLKIINKVFTN